MHHLPSPRRGIACGILVNQQTHARDMYEIFLSFDRWKTSHAQSSLIFLFLYTGYSRSKYLHQQVLYQ